MRGPPEQPEQPSRPTENCTDISAKDSEGFQHRSTGPYAQPSESLITHPSEKLNSGAVHHSDAPYKQHIGQRVGIDQRGLKSESLSSRKITSKSMLNKKHTKISPNKERAVAYARVSSKRQVDEGVSLEAQVERLIAYAEFREMRQDGVTDALLLARTLKRWAEEPHYTDLIEDVIQHNIRGIYEL